MERRPHQFWWGFFLFCAILRRILPIFDRSELKYFCLKSYFAEIPTVTAMKNN